MTGYLGETTIEQKDTPFKDYTPSDWAVYFIERYGQYDGDWHKQWVLDQIARILKGTKVIIKQAKWDNGHTEWRILTDENTSQEYKDWALSMRGEFVDGEYEYSYDVGIAP